MTTVLVIDDEPQVVDALRGYLEDEGHVVVTAGTGWEGIERAAETRPDLVVLDLRLPDIDGVEVVHRLRTFHPHPILILSGSTAESHRVAALDAGADDFLRKPFGVRELHARIRALLRRPHASLDRAPLRFGELVVDIASHEVRVSAEERQLTPTEWRLLEALLANPGTLVTHRQLFHQVWDSGYGDESRQALRTHVRALRRKLDDDAADPRYIRTETGAGYRWLTEERGVTPTRAPTTEPATTRSAREAVHDLNNVLTALRILVYLVGRRTSAAADPETVRATTGAACERLEGLVARAVDLTVELTDLTSTAASGQAVQADTFPGAILTGEREVERR